MLVDSHCHLGSEAFQADLQPVLERAWSAGVGHVVVIGESPEAVARARELARAESRVSFAAGVHPHDASGWRDDTEAWLHQLMQDPGAVALGEIGLDYHYDHSPRDIQRRVFERQLDLAARAGKPVVIHAREADADVASVLRNQPAVPVILHSFSSGPTLLAAGLALGAYISFSGMVTFRNWAQDDAVREVPADRLLVETDAPYLAPVPHRGKRNEPAFVKEVAFKVAAIRGESPDRVIRQTGENAVRVFGQRLRVPVH